MDKLHCTISYVFSAHPKRVGYCGGDNDAYEKKQVDGPSSRDIVLVPLIAGNIQVATKGSMSKQR